MATIGAKVVEVHGQKVRVLVHDNFKLSAEVGGQLYWSDHIDSLMLQIEPRLADGIPVVIVSRDHRLVRAKLLFAHDRLFESFSYEVDGGVDCMSTLTYLDEPGVDDIISAHNELVVRAQALSSDASQYLKKLKVVSPMALLMSRDGHDVVYVRPRGRRRK